MVLFRMMQWLILIGELFLFSPCFAQESPPSDSCWNFLQKANQANELGHYDAALRLFDTVLQNCKSKVVLIEGNTGKARALNGLLQFPEAISTAETALTLAQKKSFTALFERADAYYATNKIKEATADYTQLENRSLKSTNPKEKAFLLSRIARLNWRQQKKSLAFQQVSKAISLDPGNASYYLLQGDFKSAEGKVAEAMANYDKALTYRANQQLAAQKKAVAFTAAMQQKYQVQDAKELKIKLGISEKQELCDYWKSLFNTGYTYKQEELYFSLICL
ncbi:tetratricopeptide repeat protein [Flavihumibacter fluvii]|uniref:tetratricopeptide repeat protein n=1 Tax=Flavihumibacter fluvii TaxID=2838157 RepID=UPI001BDEC941|nr:hypothetical protein [Flavihumibacter fluvii]ULQ51465.1 hypothetical protein KJS93_15360 [Flavihumibacter fluvii]